MLTRYLKATLFCAAGVCLTACDFEEKNMNPNESTVIAPGPLLTYTQLNTSVDGHTKNMQIGCCSSFVTCLPGIIIQFIFVPVLVFALQKSGVIGRERI